MRGALRLCGLLVSVSRLDAFDAFVGLVRNPAIYGSSGQKVPNTATLERAARDAALASDDAALLRSIEALEEKAPVEYRSWSVIILPYNKVELAQCDSLLLDDESQCTHAGTMETRCACRSEDAA